MCVPLVHCLCLLSGSFSSVGRLCWCTSRWALNQPRFLANSQHKYPRTHTGVTFGSPIFQSSFHASPASQITSSLTAFSSVTISLLLPESPSPFFYFTSLLTLLSSSLFLFHLSFSPPDLSESLTLDVWVCFILYLLSVALSFVTLRSNIHLSGRFTLQTLRPPPPLSFWNSLDRIPQPTVSICLIPHQHMSLSPSPTCLPRLSARLSPMTYGSLLVP